MKKLVILITAIPLFAGCLVTKPFTYDPGTVANFKVLKTAYKEDVDKAKLGVLPKLMMQSTLDLFDSAVAREEAKK